MNEKVIPPNAPSVGQSGGDTRREELELELLDLEAKLKRLAHREVGQRYIVKWVAVIAGVLVIFAMMGILTHLFHSLFWGHFFFSSPALSVAMIVAPIASITAITVALFVGAFRKFDEKDLEAVGNGAAGVFNTFRAN